VNNRDKNCTVTKVKKRTEQVDASSARYLAALDRADREEGDLGEAKANRLKEKIEGLRRQMQCDDDIGGQRISSDVAQASKRECPHHRMPGDGVRAARLGWHLNG
jgi:hypothetical protein